SPSFIVATRASELDSCSAVERRDSMIIPAQEVFLPTFFPQPEHGKCILVVEDEAFVRSATCELLSWLEFEVLEAGNAAAARDIFGRNPARIDVVFCDITLADGSGVE